MVDIRAVDGGGGGICGRCRIRGFAVVGNDMSGRHIGRLLLRYIPSSLLALAVWEVAVVAFGVEMHLPTAVVAIVAVALADAWQKVCDKDALPHFWERERER